MEWLVGEGHFTMVQGEKFQIFDTQVKKGDLLEIKGKTAAQVCYSIFLLYFRYSRRVICLLICMMK